MRITSFDGLALTPAYMASDEIPLRFRSGLQELGNLAGAFDAIGDGHIREAITVTRQFKLVDTGGDDIGVQLDNIRARANKGSKRLKITMTNGDVRGTWAKLQEVNVTHTPENLKYVPINLTFEISWPWFEHNDDIWYFDSGELFDDGLFFDSNVTTQGGEGTFSIDNTGGDRITRGIIQVTGVSTSPIIIENKTTGEFIRYDGALASGEVLKIDIGAWTATIADNNAWPDISIGLNQTRLFSLQVGNNDLEFTGGGTLEIFWARVY